MSAVFERPRVLFFQEGKQASLAADFSIRQFRHIGRLLMVHGRNSYKRSAALGQFVMHRGLIISTMQVLSLLCWHRGGQRPGEEVLSAAGSTWAVLRR